MIIDKTPNGFDIVVDNKWGKLHFLDKETGLTCVVPCEIAWAGWAEIRSYNNQKWMYVDTLNDTRLTLHMGDVDDWEDPDVTFTIKIERVTITGKFKKFDLYMREN